jgi:hypothetical protein
MERDWLNAMREQVEALSKDEAKAFCIRLWFELTIAGRAIWSEEGVGEATQLNALKWLNEIQHRVWGAYSSNDPNALLRLLEQVVAHCDEAPILKSHVRVALDRSLP